MVDETPASEEVYRLRGRESPPEVVGRLKSAPASVPEPVERLSREQGDELARRSHEPDIDAILEDDAKAENPEEAWQPAARRQGPVPYGWFVLILLALAGTVATAVLLQRQSRKDPQPDLREVSMERHDEDAIEEQEAERLVTNVENTLRRYVAAGSVEDLLPLVRNPDRVEPLMREWYARNPISSRRYGRLLVFQPLDLEGRPFWVISCKVEGADGKEDRINLLAEQLADDTIRIDWETEVCYQPMPWDDYVAGRPQDKALDFRVMLEPDLKGWYSHEFSDESKWRAYRLEARGSDEYLIGYTQRGSAVEAAIHRLVEVNGGKRVSVMLRLRVPVDSQSPRGVVIEELLSERWALVTPARDSP